MELYERIAPDADGGVTSKELGIRFVLEDGDLAMFDVANGACLLTTGEWKNSEPMKQARRDDEERRLKELAEQKARAVEESFPPCSKHPCPKPMAIKRKERKNMITPIAKLALEDGPFTRVGHSVPLVNRMAKSSSTPA